MRNACKVDGCVAPVAGRGWCGKHYSRWRVHGDPLNHGNRIVGDTTRRFWSKVDASGDCWEWTGSIDTYGYGIFYLGREHGGFRGAHRLMWLTLVGPIPVGMQLDHLCRVRRCVNPDHLEPVSISENQRRRAAARLA